VPLRAMEKSSLVSRVIDELRTLIESGEWPVGSKIPAEAALVESLGVGRNTVREAVRALVHNGMLEPLQGDGTYVRAADELGAAMLRRSRRSGHLEVLEVRGSLERDAARLAALRRTPADLAALRAALARRQQAWAERDYAELIAADVEFHQAAVAAAHNDLLAELYSHLHAAQRAMLTTLVHAPVGDQARYQGDAHAALLDAIESGDQEAAQRCVTEYVTESIDSLRALQEDDS
jgi:DNA-binding FadR family transcriptional regulator